GPVARGTRRLPLVVHERRSERALRRELIVGTASKLDPVHCRLAPARHRIDVIELDEPARRAPLAGGADERALAAIPLPHGALDGGGDVAAARGRGSRAGARLPGPLRWILLRRLATLAAHAVPRGRPPPHHAPLRERGR